MLAGRRSICLTCRLLVGEGEPCDIDPSHRVVALATAAGRAELVKDVWPEGPPEVTAIAPCAPEGASLTDYSPAWINLDREERFLARFRQITIPAGLLSLAAMALLGLPGVVGFVGGTLLYAALLFGRASVPCPQCGLPFRANWFRRSEPARCESCSLLRGTPSGPPRSSTALSLPPPPLRRFPRGAPPLEPRASGIAVSGVLSGHAGALSPCERTPCLGYHLELRHSQGRDGSLLLVDGYLSSCEIRFDDGRLLRVPSRRVLIDAAYGAEGCHPAHYIVEIDPLRLPFDPCDPFAHDRVIEVLLQPGDRVFARGDFDEIVDTQSTARSYRDVPPTVLVPRGPLVLRKLAKPLP